MRRTCWMLVVLTGCPYVFGGPDLSNVDRSDTATEDTGAPADTDTDTDTDTDVDTDTDTDQTGDTGIPGDPPELLDAELNPRTDGALFGFTPTDADGDLDGGELRVTDGNTTLIYGVPDDLAGFELGEASGLVWEVPTACDGFVLDLEATATDVAGHSGAPAVASLSLQGFGVVPEIGYSPLPLGLLVPPSLLCGAVDMGGDYDNLDFEWSGGQITGTLAWNSTGDVDLYLLDAPTGQIIFGSSSVTPGEEIVRQLDPGFYQWQVEHFGGPQPSEWTLLVKVD